MVRAMVTRFGFIFDIPGRAVSYDISGGTLGMGTWKWLMEQKNKAGQRAPFADLMLTKVEKP